ncbi:uncharacterized protein LOC106695515, partial [Myotis lucifugus]|uniref:uncharacterized protein LOC106695515 n=1 Tax=Myotis lucifugus TaxID=59463 RepID=UPI000CCC331C
SAERVKKLCVWERLYVFVILCVTRSCECDYPGECERVCDTRLFKAQFNVLAVGDRGHPENIAVLVKHATFYQNNCRWLREAPVYSSCDVWSPNGRKLKNASVKDNSFTKTETNCTLNFITGHWSRPEAVPWTPRCNVTCVSLRLHSSAPRKGGTAGQLSPLIPRIHLKGLTGSAGKISSISQPGSDFSTKDADKDRCICKCAQMLTGGWWFDACGPSNLNGMYYPQKQSTNRFNGIKWYYWKGSGYSLKATAMMIRPADF